MRGKRAAGARRGPALQPWLALVPWLLVFATLSTPARAQSPQVKAFVSPSQGITTERAFKLVVQVEDAGRHQVTPPSLPQIPNVAVIGGPNTNSSFTWTNGRSTATYQLTWLLLAEAPGTVEVPALDLRIDSTVVRTAPLRFEVTAAAAPRPGGAGSGSARSGTSTDAVFLRAELATKEAWVGQSVPLTVTLFTTQRISDPRWRSQPEFRNFWVESVEVDPDAEAYRQRIGGQVYTAYPIERRMLIPSGAGEFDIEPYVAQIQVRLAGRDFFDIFGRSETIVRASEALRLRVKPLPQGAPAGFSGAVGRYELSASLDRNEAAVDDAVALSVVVEGEGSLRSIVPPPFEPSAALTVFDPKVSSTINTARGALRSRKTWEWIIVPLTPGDVELPAIRFAYFDPESGSYETASADPLRLTVQRGGRATDTPVARGGISPQQQDLIFIKPLRGRLSAGGLRAHQRGLFLAAAIFPLVAVPLLIVLGRQRARLQSDQRLVRSRRAGTRARKRLTTARKRLGQEDAPFHEEVARALIEYVADRFNRSGTGLTYDLADQLLSGNQIDPALRQRYRSCLEACDFARYVPATVGSERRSEVLDEAERILAELERAW